MGMRFRGGVEEVEGEDMAEEQWKDEVRLRDDGLILDEKDV